MNSETIEPEIVFEEWQMSRRTDIPFSFEPLQFSESFGFHTLRADDLEKSDLLGNVKVFSLQFFGVDPHDSQEGESWADPLRAITLQRLAIPNWNWYISYYGDLPVPSPIRAWILINQDLTENTLPSRHLNSIELRTREYWDHYKQRIFTEPPKEFIQEMVMRYWARNFPGSPIQGLQLPSGMIELLRQWHAQPYSEHLFKDIFDQSRLYFYMYPTENRHFLFLTNKLTYEEMVHIIDPEDLQQRANLLQQDH